MILKIYDNDQTLKNNTEIELPAFVVITGANGSGKTQLLSDLVVGHSRLFIDTSKGTAKENFENYLIEVGKSSNQSPIYIPTDPLLKIEVSLSNQFNPTGGGVVSQHMDIDNFQVHQTVAAFLYSEQLKNPEINFADTSALNNMFKAKIGRNAFMHPEQEVITQSIVQLILKISENSGKDLSELKYYDFIIYDDITLDGFFSTNLSLLFKRHIYRYNFYPDSAIKEKAPWELFEEILKDGNLPYSISVPDINDPSKLISAKLIRKADGKEIPFESLSSGEKTIMSLIFALYNSYGKTKETSLFPSVLLLDEPDASLHPSLTEYFLKVIENTFVKNNGINVIMTTHSPSTVALAPELSIFAMENGGLKKKDKNEAIKLLTEGLSSLTILYENRKQVFVEADFDKFFYENLVQILSKDYLNKEVILTFIPAGKKQEAGSSKVIFYTNGLIESGNKSVCGLLDWDSGNNKETERIKIFGKDKRYTTENYIFDPIFLSFFLLFEDVAGGINIGYNESDNINTVSNITNEKLQNCVDLIVAQVKANRVKDMVDDDRLIEIILLNGFVIKIPNWYLISPGHKLEESCIKAFPKLNGFNKEHDTLKKAVIKKAIRVHYSFLPKDITTAFEELQGLSIS
jgi:energy-coupling factor transporter ATP-binding protein EcfA2